MQASVSVKRHDKNYYKGATKKRERGRKSGIHTKVKEFFFFC